MSLRQNKSIQLLLVSCLSQVFDSLLTFSNSISVLARSNMLKKIKILICIIDPNNGLGETQVTESITFTRFPFALLLDPKVVERHRVKGQNNVIDAVWSCEYSTNYVTRQLKVMGSNPSAVLMQDLFY